MTTPLKIIALSGSLRQDSYNTAALRAAVELAPEGVEIEIAGIDGIPLFSQDDEARGIPDAVTALGARIAAADAVLIATPEYNYSVPGVLKNAIDWLSRLKPQPLAGKPGAIIGASMGQFGTARAQYHLRQTLVFMDMHLLNKPEVMIGQAHERFQDGRLSDERTREHLAKLLAALADWTRRVGGR